METYIIRIYRRDPRDPQQIVGRVEDAENGDKQTFHDAEELVGLLQSAGAAAPQVADPTARKRAESG